MLASDFPTITIPLPFAKNAGASLSNTIPQTTGVFGRASWSAGFPAANFTAEDLGGVPPDGRDMNGVLNALSLWSQWFEAGGPVFYSSSFSTAIGGYPLGAWLSATTPGSFYLSKANNNTTNPESGGVNWELVGFGTTYAGDPNGHVAGTAAGIGGITRSLLWDTVNNKGWICTTSGTTSSAIWKPFNVTDGGGGTPITGATGNVTFASVNVVNGIVQSVSNGAAATLSTLGIVRPDGTTITINNGVLTAQVGGSGTVTSVGAGTFLTSTPNPIVGIGTISGVGSTAAEIRTGTATNTIVAPSTLISAATPVSLSDGPSIAWDMNAGFNAKVTYTSGPTRTFAAPLNAKIGLPYSLQINSGPGSIITTFPSNFNFGAFGSPTLSTVPNKDDFIFMHCYDATPGNPKFICSHIPPA